MVRCSRCGGWSAWAERCGTRCRGLPWGVCSAAVLYLRDRRSFRGEGAEVENSKSRRSWPTLTVG